MTEKIEVVDYQALTMFKQKMLTETVENGNKKAVTSDAVSQKLSNEYLGKNDLEYATDEDILALFN